MGISFTEQQQQVIELRDCNILISAAAGSGKTAVLVERIAQIVCDETHPVDIDHLLVVTFTRAAASEMRERVGRRIQELLKEHPENTHIQRQAALVYKAQITTIDSFCLNLLRNHFQDIGMDPDFRIMDEGEKKLLIAETMDAFLERVYCRISENSDSENREKASETDPLEELDILAVRNLVDHFRNGNSDKTLEKTILSLCEYAESFPWPEDFLLERKADYSVNSVEEMEKTPVGSYLLGFLQKKYQGIGQRLDDLRRICEEADGPYMYGELLEQEAELCFSLSQCEHLRQMEEGMGALFSGRLSSKKDPSVDVLKREHVKAGRDAIKKSVSSLKENFFKTPLALQEVQGSACYEIINTLIDLTILYRRSLTLEKRKRKVLDFSDIEHLALDILLIKQGDSSIPSPVAEQYQQYFHEIMIDEYQDSNLVQEYLLRAISKEQSQTGGHNRFMVGDVKQSIYSFRQARPDIFMEKYTTYSENGERRRIDLVKNFRSRSQVLDTANHIFKRVMQKETGGLAYDAAAKLYVGADFIPGENFSSELLLFNTEYRQMLQQLMGGAVKRETCEAFMMASRIQQLVHSQKVTKRNKDNQELVGARYKDIVILHRSPGTCADIYKKVFEAYGIPLVIPSQKGYFSATEVVNVLQLLRSLGNMRDDIPLFGTMISCFGGFTEEEIALLRIGRKKTTLYGAMKAFVKEHEEDADSETEEGKHIRDLTGRLKDFLHQMEVYRKKAIHMTIRELLDELFEDYHYLEYISALPGGEKRLANVEMLLSKASAFEKTSYYGVFHFVQYIDLLQKYNQDMGEADTLDEAADVVRLMSIHKSKGLEFPITIVAGLGHGFNDKDLKEPLILDNMLGLGCKYVDTDQNISNKTLRYNVVATHIKEENRSEELRVLYVALTRAKEKLILVGDYEQAEEVAERTKEYCHDRLSFDRFMDSKCYMDFLLPIVGNTDLDIKVASPDAFLQDLLSKEKQKVADRGALSLLGASADEELVSALHSQMEYVYPREDLRQLYTKTTVSRLKEAAYEQSALESDEFGNVSRYLVDDLSYLDAETVIKDTQDAVMDAEDAANNAQNALKDREDTLIDRIEADAGYIPKFRRETNPISGTTRGNAYHRVMELMDYDRVLCSCIGTYPNTEGDFLQKVKIALTDGSLYQSVKNFLDEEVTSGRLSEEYRKAIFMDKILLFLQNKLTYRLWGAFQRTDLFREQPFVYGITADRLDSSFSGEEIMLIQGIVDAYFIENDSIVLLDYKTDKVSNGETLWKRYNIQLAYYKEALEHLTGMEVKESVLYSFGLGEVVSGELVF